MSLRVNFWFAKNLYRKDAQAKTAKLYSLWEELEAVKAAYAEYMDN